MTIAADPRKLRAEAPTGLAARLLARNGGYAGPTSGFAPGYVQGNLAILPRALAADFLRFCQLNPKPCPLIGVTEPGDARVPALGADLDLRTDLPRYRVWRNGELVDEPTDIKASWRDDLVGFVARLLVGLVRGGVLEDGIPLRHVARGAMSRCTAPTSPACRRAFAGPLVVSMRPAEARGRHPRRSDHPRFPAGTARRASRLQH